MEFNQFGLPIVEDIEQFSKIINISTYNIYKMSKTSDLYYKEVEIPKGLCSVRILACPSYKMKAVQAWILRMILEKIKPHSSATAFYEFSIKENVARHQGNKFFLCMDVENFFPSTKRERVFQFFSNYYNSQVATLFTNFCTYKGGLPQGGVTSPALSNILNFNLDVSISKYCSLENLTYTRYADDITVSSNNKEKLKDIRKFITKELLEYGYRVNYKKTRILKPGIKRKVTGLIYADNGKIGIGREKERMLRAKIHNLELKASSKEEFLKELYSIQGWFAFLWSVDVEAHNRLLNYWKKLNEKSGNSEIASTIDRLSKTKIANK